MCRAACRFPRRKRHLMQQVVMRHLMWLAVVSVFCCGVKADTTHPTNEVGTLWKHIPLICTQASISQTASSRCLHQTEARYSSRAPMAPFLMLPYNPAQGAPDAPHSSFWHRWIAALHLFSSQLSGWSVSVSPGGIRLFLGSSHLCQVWPLPSFFLHPSTLTLVILHFGTLKLV